MLGRFSEEALLAFAASHNLNTENQDFSEGVFDFKVCQKADGQHYGIPDKAKCGVGAKEVKTAPSSGFLGVKPGNAINYETAKRQGEEKTKAWPTMRIETLRNSASKGYQQKIFEMERAYEKGFLETPGVGSKGNAPLAKKLASLGVDLNLLAADNLLPMEAHKGLSNKIRSVSTDSQYAALKKLATAAAQGNKKAIETAKSFSAVDAKSTPKSQAKPKPAEKAPSCQELRENLERIDAQMEWATGRGWGNKHMAKDRARVAEIINRRGC